MPSKRRGSRANHGRPQLAIPSDYETDTATATDFAAAQYLAPPPVRTNTELNLAVLRRYLPNIQAIISIAPFATVYQYSQETNSWEKAGAEGTGFVCQLSTGHAGRSKYSVIVLNRKSLNNFVVELDRVGADNIEITEEYVILPVVKYDGEAVVYGLWIFSDENGGGGLTDTRDMVAAKIVECAMRAEAARDMMGPSEGHEELSGVPEINLDGGYEHFDRSTPMQYTGQPLDLMSLFGKSAAPASQEAPAFEQAFAQPTPVQSQIQHPHFTPNADTDLFRTSHVPTAPQQHAQAAPPMT